MKKIYRPFIKGTNWALAGILSLLGFASCSNDGGETPAEYGTPHAKYTIKGAVTDKEGNPIEGINVHVKMPFEWNGGEGVADTNKEGKFDITYTTFPDDKFTLIAKDIDGEENGSFQTDSVEVTFTKDDFYEDGKRWYEGAARKEIPNIVLKETVKEETVKEEKGDE